MLHHLEDILHALLLCYVVEVSFIIPKLNQLFFSYSISDVPKWTPPYGKDDDILNFEIFGFNYI